MSMLDTNIAQQILYSAFIVAIWKELKIPFGSRSIVNWNFFFIMFTIKLTGGFRQFIFIIAVWEVLNIHFWSQIDC